MSKYLGIINRKEFDTWTKKEQLDFLVEEKVCQWSSVYSLVVDDKVVDEPLEPKLKFEPTQEVIDEFHQYFIEQYDALISTPVVSFFSELNQSNFGLEEKDKRKKALKKFDEVYNQVNLNYELIRKKKGIGLLETITNSSRFEKLHFAREENKKDLCPLPIAMATFYGDEEFFSSSTFKELEFVKDTINFEVALKTLVNLNNQYHFEDDLYFSELGELKKLYELYYHIFSSFKAFIYTNKKIRGFKELIPSNIESLYSALKKNDLILKRRSDFKRYVLNEHQIKVSKIRKYEIGENLEHDSRVKNFIEDLEKNAVK